ncbi:MAG: hypothetical protein ACO25B_11615 [Chitinophagaceae bacterium]
MNAEKLIGEDLLHLQQEKGKVCVSVIVPTHRLSHERRVDLTETEKAVEQAKELLRYKFGENDIKPVVRNLDELFKSVDFSRNQDGLGLYVSADTKMLVKFPFPVERKIMAGKQFELRDLLYKVNHQTPYLVLLITVKEVKLFLGQLDEVTEIRDGFFPAVFHDDYDYATPSRSSSQAGYTHVKNFERDKSVMIEKRMKDFFRETDDKLNRYLAEEIPLILAGSTKEIAWFERVSEHTNRIIERFKGNYSHSHPNRIAELVRPAMEAHLQKEREKMLEEFKEILGARKGVSGIQQAWEAAGEGKAYKLLVEKDYRMPGFEKAGDPHLYLRPPAGTHRVIADAVDELITRVLEKKGRVYFLENDALKDWQHIALITRY